MANEEHVALLKQGVEAWNAWRDENPIIRPDLSGANLSGWDLSKANLRRADLSEANLAGANLEFTDFGDADLVGTNVQEAEADGVNFRRADLRGANLSGAALIAGEFSQADLSGATLFLANLRFAFLQGANLHKADIGKANLNSAYLNGANLLGADLQEANLLETDFTAANLTGCHVYGISAWGVRLEGAKQQNLVITPKRSVADITVDNIEVAQFIYLMLHNQKIRDVIDTISSKVVLILGRFTDERKAVLDALRGELRKHNYLPILFDFNVPERRDITETVSLLARMARFIVADITDAKSIPMELVEIVPHLPSVPVQPLLLEGSTEYAMFEHLKRFPWVLKTYTYPSSERLIANLAERVIGPAEDYAQSKTRPA